MQPLNALQQLNRDVGEKVLEEAKHNPQAFAGKYVGIANGIVVVATDDLNELVRRLDAVEPDPSNTYCVEIGRDYSKVYEIWEMA